MLSGLLAYGVRILPGLLLIAACYLPARRERDPMLRVMVLVLGFVLTRDAMTPLGFWRLGAVGAVPWLRFTDQAGILLLFGLGTLALTAGVLRLDGELRALVRWGRLTPATLAWGVGGGVLAAAPILLLSLPTPMAARGGAVAVTLLPVLPGVDGHRRRVAAARLHPVRGADLRLPAAARRRDRRCPRTRAGHLPAGGRAGLSRRKVGSSPGMAAPASRTDRSTR